MDSQEFYRAARFQSAEPRSHTVSGGVVMVQFSGPPGAIREEDLDGCPVLPPNGQRKLLIVTTKIVNFSQMKSEE